MGLEEGALSRKRELIEELIFHAMYNEKDNYLAIVAEVENWAKRGGTVLTAAKWIRCLVSKGKDRLAPGRVRLNIKRTWPGAAKVESEEDDEEDEEDGDDADEVMPQPKKRGAPRTRGA